MLTCSRCLAPLTPDTPYRAWVATGRCRACLIGRSASGNECSWCLDEFQIEARPNESHGICQRHADAMIARAEARRAATSDTRG